MQLPVSPVAGAWRLGMEIKFDRNTAKDMAEILLKFMGLPWGTNAEVLLRTNDTGDVILKLDRDGITIILEKRD